MKVLVIENPRVPWSNIRGFSVRNEPKSMILNSLRFGDLLSLSIINKITDHYRRRKKMGLIWKIIQLPRYLNLVNILKNKKKLVRSRIFIYRESDEFSGCRTIRVRTGSHIEFRYFKRTLFLIFFPLFSYLHFGIFKVATSGIWLPLCTKRRYIRAILNLCVILKYRPLSTVPFDLGFSTTEIFYCPLSPISVHFRLDLVHW